MPLPRFFILILVIFCLATPLAAQNAASATQAPAVQQTSPAAPGAMGSPAPTAQVTPAAVPAPPAPRPDEKLVLKEGTQINLKFAQPLSSKTAVEGDPINFVLAEDLKIADVVLAKAGTMALGTVSHSQKAGMLGKAGELNIRLEYLKCGDTKVRLRGSQGKEGQGKEGTAVALTVLFGPIGLIKHGKNVEVKEGAPLTAYVDQDATLSRLQAPGE